MRHGTECGCHSRRRQPPRGLQSLSAWQGLPRAAAQPNVRARRPALRPITREPDDLSPRPITSQLTPPELSHVHSLPVTSSWEQHLSLFPVDPTSQHSPAHEKTLSVSGPVGAAATAPYAMSTAQFRNTCGGERAETTTGTPTTQSRD